jgi:hypothetical protein
MKTLFTHEKRWHRVILFSIVFMVVPLLVGDLLKHLIL